MEQNRVYETSPLYEGQIFVTPKLAKEWLDKQWGNRTVPDSTLLSYKRDMLNGTFQWNAQSMTLVFSKEGNIIDGQTRLKAMLEANISHQMFIYRDPVLKSAGDGIFDRGRQRSEVSLSNLSANAFSVAKAILNTVDRTKKWTLTEKENAFEIMKQKTEFSNNYESFFSFTPKGFNTDVFLGCQFAFMHGQKDVFEIVKDARLKEPQTVKGANLKRHIELPICVNWITNKGNRAARTGQTFQLEIFLFLIGKNPTNYKTSTKRQAYYDSFQAYAKFLLNEESNDEHYLIEE